MKPGIYFRPHAYLRIVVTECWGEGELDDQDYWLVEGYYVNPNNGLYFGEVPVKINKDHKLQMLNRRG